MAGQVDILLWILPFSCIFFAADAEDSCTQKLWCKDCITAREGCTWCEDENFVQSRCKYEADMLLAGCKTIHSSNNSADFLQNDEFRDVSDNYNAIQLTPQHVSVTLKPEKEYVVDMRYRVSQNLPIDMYFVLDFSVTMKSRIQQLANLTASLIYQLQENFTQNIHIGFGSFLDKPIQPFHITTPEHLENPCILQKAVCEQSYGYIHRSSLNKDINKFIDTIRKAETSANFDPMEGGLDAVMQASLCPDIIGWRNKTRRIMVYISDSGFHFAGDAKLAGIDTPNDGLCHMKQVNNSGEEFIYTHSTMLDYPSIGHLKKVLSDNNINTFFVVKQEDQMIYKALTDMIGTQAATEIMDVTGAEKIVNRIIEYYTNLSSKVSIKAENIPGEMEIIAESNCSGPNVINLKDQEIRCTGLEIGKEVFFKITLKLDRCPKDKKTVHTIQLVPSGVQESLRLDIRYICDCMCTNSPQLDDDQCYYGNGTYECGVCRCNEGRIGKNCQCDSSESTTDLSIDEARCKKSNESVCEDHGKCQCGQCVCMKEYRGKYCDCNITDCTFPGSSLECSGALKGDCNCTTGTCACKTGYQGKYCRCPADDVCVAEGDIKKCSGNGKCDCGKCVCQPGFWGIFCEDCQDSDCSICRRCGNITHQDCIKCLVLNKFNDSFDQTECKACSGINHTELKSLPKEQKICDIQHKDNCQLRYSLYCESDDAPNIYYLAVPSCVKPPNLLLIVMSVVSGIVCVGILLLIIWKILTSVYDKIEYARFEQEIKNPKWNKRDNPIYRSPLTHNMNPAYRRKAD